MSLYTENDSDSGWSPAKILGFLLTLAGVVVVLWTVAEIFQLFTQGSAFITLNEIIPRKWFSPKPATRTCSCRASS